MVLLASDAEHRALHCKGEDADYCDLGSGMKSIQMNRYGAPVGWQDLTEAELSKLIAEAHEERTVRNLIASYEGKKTDENSPPLSAEIVRKICESFPTDRVGILNTLKWSYDHWYFYYVGMYVGVEKDGYIHS